MVAKRKASRTGGVRRRHLLGAAAALTATAMVPGRSAAQQPVPLTIAGAWPPDALGIADGTEVFLASLSALLGEEAKVTFLPAGEPIAPRDLLAAVAEGRADLAYTTPHFAIDKAPALRFFAGPPFGMTVAEFRAWLAFAGGQQLWERAYAPLGLLPFYAGSSGPQAGGWFKEPLEGAAGLEGKRVRIAGMGAELFRRLGAETVLTPPAEILEALDKGRLDGVDWIGPWNDIAFELPRAARYCYMPGFHEPAPTIEVLANRTRYEALSPRIRSAIGAAAELAAQRTLASFHYHDAESYRRLMSDFDVEVLNFPPELVERAARESRLMLQEAAGADALAAETHQSYSRFLKLAADYAPRAEQGFLNLRTLALG